MTIRDLAFAWNWEFDEDYVKGLERECQQRSISVVQITSANLRDVLSQIRSGEIVFRAFYDRASDADEAFLPLVSLLDVPSIRVMNPHRFVVHAVDKATMHLECLSHGLNVPMTIILSPFHQQVQMEIPSEDLNMLGTPFVIKPANTTGGGTGVVLNAQTIEDVREARKLHSDDKYLLQEFIHPKNLDGKRAWFRAYCVFSDVIICWWDDVTHEYSELSADEEARYHLSGLREVMRTIREMCHLDFFSSEIALTDGEKYIVVDYVNEICDMRLKSKYRNGAPDAIVYRIASLIAQEIERHLALLPSPSGIQR